MEDKRRILCSKDKKNCTKLRIELKNMDVWMDRWTTILLYHVIS
jgi:hypothetical protein